MRTLRNTLEHLFNPLHVYCRLLKLGVTQTTALRLCSIYERYIYRFHT